MMGPMLITRLAHAGVLVEAAGSRVVIDPGVFCPDEAFEVGGLDAIVITHQHPTTSTATVWGVCSRAIPPPRC